MSDDARTGMDASLLMWSTAHGLAAAFAIVAMPAMAGSGDIRDHSTASRADQTAYDSASNASGGHTANDRASCSTNSRATDVPVLTGRGAGAETEREQGHTEKYFHAVSSNN